MAGSTGRPGTFNDDVRNIDRGVTSMMQRIRRTSLGLLTSVAIIGFAGLASAAEERFEVTSVKSVRPKIVALVDALQKRDAKASKAAAEAYDSTWNGIEVYINIRSKETYDLLEHEHQAKIEKALEAPNPDLAATLREAQALLVDYDKAIDMVAKAQPLNPLYDEVTRLRVVRSHLREVPPALKAGDFAKARKSFEEFDNNWDSIEDLVKARSADAYTAIEKGMIDIEKSLMPDKPDVAQATALVQGVMTKYNEIVAQITREARAAK
jgi:tetratricopeptide (TPR) repeat protein